MSQLNILQYSKYFSFFPDTSKKKFNLCLPRIDRNHIVPTINKHTNLTKNDLYARSIVLLIDEINFKIVVEILGSVLIMISSKFKNPSIETSDENLNSFIKGNLEEIKFQFDVNVGRDWYLDFSSQITEKQMFSGSLNVSYNEDMITFVHKMAKRMIYWTGVLAFKAGSKLMKATSSSLESYHEILKHKLLNERKVELDELIKAMEFYIDTLLHEETGMIGK